jgi:hypothetical protein
VFAYQRNATGPQRQIAGKPATYRLTVAGTH